MQVIANINGAELSLEVDTGAMLSESVLFAEWAVPIVPIVNGDGLVRICCDYKVTANISARADTYPLPRIDDLLSSLAGGKSFSK